MAGCWFCQATSIQNACLELWLLVVVIGVFGVVAHNDECFITFHFLPDCQSQMVVVVAAMAPEMELFAWYMQLHLNWKRTQYLLLNMLILQQWQLQDTLLIDMYRLIQTSTCFIPFWTPSNSDSIPWLRNAASVWGLQMQETANRIAVKDANPGFPQTGHWMVSFSTCFFLKIYILYIRSLKIHSMSSMLTQISCGYSLGFFVSISSYFDIWTTCSWYYEKKFGFHIPGWAR